MYKQVLGTVLLLGLAGIVLFNFVQQNKDTSEADEPNAYNVNGEVNTEGGSIAPVESAGLEPGDMAPDFELETLDGKTVKLSDYKGKKVILNFWATWCPPCREEMPEMQDFHDEYGDEVEILAVNLTGSENKVKDVHEYIEKYDYTYTIPMDKDSTVGDEYRAFSVPTTYFIGTDGKIQQPRKIGPMTYDFMEEMADSLK
ncbi:cytochrome C biogenesis protein [Virgibacillus profundi]|uniref:Cytochrome C biogenesis protein n=1 Tax=Virgibacillus profundi TaxID=2024555 RepID=A0A2A2IE72_9BACI|nr:TlpA disulfide reductase family protein [Virgibacillus profundi]PAV29383.1 cytochrome C biogenesis protein [Virgibacillus profundi]PXY53553.1 TlpA family protein disulfide reductase [Virgibacillus profundi]